MRVGFFTAIFREWDFERVVRWAAEHGFSVIEVYAAPGSKHIDPAADGGRVGEIKRLLEAHGVEVSALSYHPNNLDPDPEKRRRNHEHLRLCIDMAHRLEVPVVSTFVGSPAHFLTLDLERALAQIKEAFEPLVKHAEDAGVRLAIENCPMGGWNLAYSPAMWRALFELVPSPSLGLNFDPSHLVWQFIDYVKAVRDFGDRIFHVHAKDTEIMYERLDEVGIYGGGWWRYRVPGWGLIDWRALVSALREAGYDYVLSIEHEDPLFGPEEGVLAAKKYLSQIVP